MYSKRYILHVLYTRAHKHISEGSKKHTFTLVSVHELKPFTAAAVEATNCVGAVMVTVVTAIVALINICE